MRQEIVVVFTAKSVERILSEGGSAAWRLDRNHARRCEYVVCTRNINSPWGDGTEDHQSAFLIGKIHDVVPCRPTPENAEHEKKRFLIEFDQYARLNIPNAWKGDRNPVKYARLDDLGIDPTKLAWETMPHVTETPKRDTSREAASMNGAGVKALTMAEAKKGLALTFNVPPEAIEITIRG
jgi:hypothetical protein